MNLKKEFECNLEKLNKEFPQTVEMEDVKKEVSTMRPNSLRTSMIQDSRKELQKQIDIKPDPNRNDPPIRSRDTNPTNSKTTSPTRLKPMRVEGSRSAESQTNIDNKARSVLNEFASFVTNTETITPITTTLSRQVSQEMPIITSAPLPQSDNGPLNVD